MGSRLRWYALVVLILALLFDLVIWGAVPQLPTIGAGISASAHREAPLATTYITLGAPLDKAIPALGTFGTVYLQDAFAEGTQRLADTPTLSMELIFGESWNRAHRWLKAAYWLPPILLVVTILSWWLRSREVRLIPHR